ncbi:hypothetical protein [Kordia sp.]|uniref:hypothetical protein n=1 Tax=Kordia sp. TaxID=1965332 RepID=UPI003B5ADC25
MRLLKHIFSTVKKESPILFTIVMLHFVGAIVCVGGIFIDERTLAGINVWIKPLKFCVSGGIYIMTVGFLMTKYPYSKTKKNIMNNIVSWTLLLEIGIIFYQAARGVRSHYNQESLFDGLLFAAMGILIAINVLQMILFVFDAARLKMKVAKPIQVAIFMGWIVVIVGSWVGGQMIGQMAHNVGVADGGEGLPILNWSTVAGDLRVAHFFGLHGIQIIPLFAWILVKKWKATTTKRVLTVIVFGLLFSAWIAYMFYQAKQGMPLIKL